MSTSHRIVSSLHAHGDTIFSTQITSLATPPKPVGSFGRPFLLKNQTVPSQQSLKKTFLLSFEGKFQLGNAFVFVSLNILICQQTNFEFAVEQTTSCWKQKTLMYDRTNFEFAVLQSISIRKQENTTSCYRSTQNGHVHCLLAENGHLTVPSKLWAWLRWRTSNTISQAFFYSHLRNTQPRLKSIHRSRVRNATWRNSKEHAWPVLKQLLWSVHPIKLRDSNYGSPPNVTCWRNFGVTNKRLFQSNIICYRELFIVRPTSDSVARNRSQGSRCNNH